MSLNDPSLCEKLKQWFENNKLLQQVIRRHTPQINAEIDPKGTILDQLFGYGYISTEEKRSFEKIESKAERARNFMNLMFEKSNPEIFVALMAIFSNIAEYKWIVKEIYTEMHPGRDERLIIFEETLGIFRNFPHTFCSLYKDIIDSEERIIKLYYAVSSENGQFDAGLVSSREKLPEEIHKVEFRVSDKGSIPVHGEITDFLEKSSQWSSLVKLFPSAHTKIQAVLEDCYSLGRCLHAAWKDFKSLNAGVYFALRTMNILSNEGVRVTKRTQDSIQTLFESVMSEVVSRVTSEKKSEGTCNDRNQDVEVGQSQKKRNLGSNGLSHFPGPGVACG